MAAAVAVAGAAEVVVVAVLVVVLVAIGGGPEATPSREPEATRIPPLTVCRNLKRPSWFRMISYGR